MICVRLLEFKISVVNLRIHEVTFMHIYVNEFRFVRAVFNSWRSDNRHLNIHGAVTTDI